MEVFASFLRIDVQVFTSPEIIYVIGIMDICRSSQYGEGCELSAPHFYRCLQSLVTCSALS